MPSAVNHSMTPFEWGLLLALSLLWGGSFFFIGIAVKELPPMTIVALRVSLAALALLVIVRIAGLRMPRDARAWRAFFVMSTINNLLPGIFASDAQRRHVEGIVALTGRPFDEVWAERGRANPAQRYGDPAELGAACAYLCAAQAGYITGQNLLVDGGGYPGVF